MCAGELQGAALTRLALQTLGSFDFGSMRLLDFVRDHVTLFLDDPDVSVRRAAAAAAAKSTASSRQRSSRISWKHFSESGR